MKQHKQYRNTLLLGASCLAITLISAPQILQAQTCNGSQSRTVTCRVSSSDAIVSNANCGPLAQSQPAVTQSCTYPCPPPPPPPGDGGDGGGDGVGYDSDGNGIPDYLDVDDDGDGVLTRDEITDEDGNIIFPYPDSNGNGTPDYLDPDFPGEDTDS